MIFKVKLFIIFYLFNCVVSFSQINGPCANANFETTAPGTYTNANSVGCWTISSQSFTNCNTPVAWTLGSPEFSIVTTPIFNVPHIGTLAHSPLGGTKVAKLNNFTPNSLATKLTYTTFVASPFTYLNFSYAGVWQSSNHQCCEQSFFKVVLRDSLGNIATCQSYSLSADPANCLAGLSYSQSIGAVWNNWQTQFIDLSSYAGSSVTIEVISRDCTQGDHYGTVYFDMQCYVQIPPIICFPGTYIFQGHINYCSGSPVASICAPAGYLSYSWTPPVGAATISPAQATLSCLTVNNPSPGAVYTVQLSSSPNCGFNSSAIFTLTPGTLSITTLGASPSCSLGSSGSATVSAIGSITGYNYLWINQTNSVVGTNSVVNNLAPGVYSIQVSAINAASCGSVVATVTVNAAPNAVINLLQPICNIPPVIGIPGGSNYQWYNGNVLIPAAQGGTLSSYTVIAPVHGAVYSFTYSSPQGCKDSIRYTLFQSSPGNMAITYNKLICQGASNGQVVISMTPAVGSPSGNNSFSVVSTGSLTPPYNSSINPTPLYTYTANNLSANGTYSVRTFDGSCVYSTTFSVLPHFFSYNLVPNTATVCHGSQVAAGVTFTSPVAPAQYSYSWSPNVFLAAGIPLLQNTIITPTVVLGGSVAIIYTVMVTPTLVNCPLTKTLSISCFNPLTPTIAPVTTSFCPNAPINYTISVSPTGGSFYTGGNNSISNPAGVIIPANANTGINTFTYVNAPGNCAASSTGSFFVLQSPTLNVIGSEKICAGQSTTLSVSGGNSYLWSNNLTASLLVVSPTSNTSYSVIGTHTINACTTTKVFNVQVFQYPQTSIIGNTLICIGKSSTLTASGANNYTWSNGNQNPIIVVNPSISTVYFLNGSPGGWSCINTSSILVNVAPLPSVTISGNLTPCWLDVNYLAANGADTYLWNTFATTQQIQSSPNFFNSYYSVIGTNTTTGCTNFASVTVTLTNCTDVNELDLENLLFVLYPNPVSEILNIGLKIKTEKIEFVLTNVLGEQVLSVQKLELKDREIKIDISGTKSGVYFLQVYNDGKLITSEKIIKEN